MFVTTLRNVRSACVTTDFDLGLKNIESSVEFRAFVVLLAYYLDKWRTLQTP